MRRPIPGLLLAGLLMLTGCVVAPVRESPYPPVPPARAEVVPRPPVSERPLTWQPGHWDWVGNGYLWREGEWVPRAGHGGMWQDGFWTYGESGGWVWVPGHWV
ncbi:MAG: YXWGXW repeat-containing protein [Acidisphaera sp.]|nr:YXWGXW repeat-containing protein [Acidisphaera sp.]